MSATHTAPWHWTFSPLSNERIALVSANNKDVLLITDDRDGNLFCEIAPEHARLMAAAPELRAALDYLQASPNDPRAHQQAIRALATAKGETPANQTDHSP